MEDLPSAEVLLSWLEQFKAAHVRCLHQISEEVNTDLMDKWTINKRQQDSVCQTEHKMHSSQHTLPESDSHKNLYSLVMMLFPESARHGGSPLDIDVMDTLFYLSDNSILYIFKDPKKGLVKVRNRTVNVFDLFLRRKQAQENCIASNATYKQSCTSSSNLKRKTPQVNRANSSRQTNRGNQFCQTKKDRIDSASSFCTLAADCKTEKFLKQMAGPKQNGFFLNYVALLRYKDHSFVRLKQNEFKAILSNPLYSNQRFKNINNTQYIQSLPAQSCLFTEGYGQYRISFSFERMHCDKLFKLAEFLLQRQSNHHIPQQQRKREYFKQIIQSFSKEVYLHYLIFEIYCFVSMHYNRKVQSGTFVFTRLGESSFSLSGVDFLVISQQKHVQYYKRQVFESKKVHFEDNKNPLEEKVDFFTQNSQEKSLLQKYMFNFMDQTHSNIKRQVTEFVQDRLEKVKNSKDKTVSKMIFKIINPNVRADFHQILQKEKSLDHLLRNKSKILKYSRGFGPSSRAQKQRNLNKQLKTKASQYIVTARKEQFGYKSITKAKNGPQVQPLFVFSGI